MLSCPLPVNGIPVRTYPQVKRVSYVALTFCGSEIPAITRRLELLSNLFPNVERLYVRLPTLKVVVGKVEEEARSIARAKKNKEGETREVSDAEYIHNTVATVMNSFPTPSALTVRLYFPKVTHCWYDEFDSVSQHVQRKVLQLC